MRDEHITILKAKTSALSDALAQNEADLESAVLNRSKAAGPVEKRAGIGQAAALLSEKGRIIRELHMVKRLLARAEGDEFDFDAAASDRNVRTA